MVVVVVVVLVIVAVVVLLCVLYSERGARHDVSPQLDNLFGNMSGSVTPRDDEAFDAPPRRGHLTPVHLQEPAPLPDACGALDACLDVAAEAAAAKAAEKKSAKTLAASQHVSPPVARRIPMKRPAAAVGNVPALAPPPPGAPSPSAPVRSVLKRPAAPRVLHSAVSGVRRHVPACGRRKRKHRY